MRKIFKTIGLICMAVVVAVGSIFVTKKQTQNEYSFASTDVNIPDISEDLYFDFDISQSNIAFKGSNIYIPLRRYEQQEVLDYVLLKISFANSLVDDSFIYSFGGSTGFLVQNQYVYDGITFNYNVMSYVRAGSSSSSVSVSSNLIFGNIYSTYLYYGLNSTAVSVPMYIIGSENLLSTNITRCCVGSSSNVVGLSGSYNFIIYFDENSNYVGFYFNSGGYNIENRMYYFVTDFSDDYKYNQGYQEGLADNQKTIYNSGYSAGYDIGYDKGRINGIAESNDYTFLGLIGAVIDAPVSIFSSLFNFTFLGINLWSFITSLLTIALILFVIKIFMRR